jgi:drug/metabolite transporter (DMT)-like permease
MMPYLWMTAGSFAFSVMGAFAHAASEKCDWQVVAFARSTLIVLLVGGLAAWNRTPFVFFRPARLWLRSLSGSISLLCTFYAFMHLPVSNVLTLTNLFPIWVAVLSWYVTGVRPSARVGLAIACAIGGLFLLPQPELEGGKLAFWIAIGASFFTAVAMLGLHRLHDVNPKAVVVHFSMVSLLFVTLAFWIFPRTASPSSLSDPVTWFELLGVGVSASVGQLLLTKAFAAGDPSKVSVVGLTSVVFALLLDVAISRHAIDSRSMLGMALILLPTAWVMLERHEKDETIPVDVEETVE